MEHHEGNVIIVKLLLAGGAQVNASGPDERKTSFYFAVNRDYHETAKTLLDHGTDVDAIDADVQRPLYMAVSRKQLETVESLLDQNVNIEAVGHEERPALHYACFGAADNLPLLRLLLKRRADVEACGPRKKKTWLHFAVMKGYHKTAKCLLEHGAKPRAKNVNGRRPIDFVRRAKHGQGQKIEVGRTSEESMTGNIISLSMNEDSVASV